MSLALTGWGWKDADSRVTARAVGEARDCTSVLGGASRCIIEFELDGERYQALTHTHRNKVKAVEGQKFEVAYDPEAPAWAAYVDEGTIHATRQFWSYIGSALLSLFFGVAVWFKKI